MTTGTPEASADVSRLAEALRTTAKEANVTTMEVLYQAAGYLLSEMEARVPVDTGTLRGSLGVRVVGEAIQIGPDMSEAPYAGYVEFGTKPHEIRPKQGKALRFTVNGRVVYARVVHHPGTKPAHFILDAFNAWVDSLGEMAAEANVQVLVNEADK